MKTWRFEAFGREIFKVEVIEKITVSDVMRQMLDEGMAEEDDLDEEDDSIYEELAEGMIPCESCGEMFDPDIVDIDENENLRSRFADMTERLVWDASQDYPDPPDSLFE